MRTSQVDAQVLVVAKAPRPGHVKTRLCPPLSHAGAAAVARAALMDTLDSVVAAGPAGRRWSWTGKSGAGSGLVCT